MLLLEDYPTSKKPRNTHSDLLTEDYFSNLLIQVKTAQYYVRIKNDDKKGE